MYITEDHLGYYVAKSGKVADVSSIKRKTGIATSDTEIMFTLTMKIFVETPNVLTCGGHSIYVVVEGLVPFCWCCGASGHLSKSCPGKNSAPSPNNISNTSGTSF